MTNEPEAIEPSLDGGYMQFQIPNHPYSVMRIPWGMNIDWYVAEAFKLGSAIDQAFSEAETESETGQSDTRPAQQQQAQSQQPQRQQTQRNTPPARSQSGQYPDRGVFCAAHGVEMKKSHKDRAPDKYYHGGAEGELFDGREGPTKWCNQYFRNTVNINKESNDAANNAIRAASNGDDYYERPVAATAGSDDAPPLTDADRGGF